MGPGFDINGPGIGYGFADPGIGIVGPCDIGGTFSDHGLSVRISSGRGAGVSDGIGTDAPICPGTGGMTAERGVIDPLPMLLPYPGSADPEKEPDLIDDPVEAFRPVPGCPDHVPCPFWLI